MLHISNNFLEKNRNLFFIFFTLAYVVCAMNIPVSIYSLAGHDDALFMQNAYRILKGEWLGNTYTQMTLAKGQGFSLFLAVNAVIGVPITLTIAIFYAFCCWVLSNTLMRLGLPIFVSLIAFALMLFHPELIPTRIIRDNIYPGLSLLLLAAAIDVIFLNQRRVSILCFYGAAIALFWITREEGIWIIPALGLILIYRLITIWLSKNKNDAIALAKNSALVAIGFTLPILAICSLNYYKYGAFLTVDFKDQNFAKSMSLLNSIKTDKKLSHVPVNKEQRNIAYSVSPAFAELQEYFDNRGLHWTRPGCNNYKESCGDYAGGWFMWAYRDAVFERGYYKNFDEASAFYGRVSEEISTACNSKKIECASGSLGFLPKLNETEIIQMPSSFAAFYNRITVQEKVHLNDGPSMDNNGILSQMRLFLRYPLSVPSQDESLLWVKGWYYDQNNARSWLKLKCSGKASKSIAREDSLDIAAFTKDPAATKQRFSIKVSNPDKCALITSKGKKLSLNSIYQKRSGPIKISPENTLYIDQAEKNTPNQILETAKTIKYSLTSIYKIVSPILFWMGVISFIASFLYYLVKMKLPEPMFIVTLAAWTLVATRAVILVLIDISSFPAINALYVGPAFPLSIVASITSIFACYALANNLLRYKACN